MEFLIYYIMSYLPGADDENGQGLAEYALILAMIAILAIAAVTFMGGQINAVLSKVGKSI